MITASLALILGWLSLGDECVLADGRVLDAPLHAQSIVVPIGATVYVHEDVLLQAEVSIVIEGTIIGLPRQGSGPDRGHGIHLSAGTLIDVAGTIRGGAGRSLEQVATNVGERGGRGSTILLEAPVVFVDGLVMAGAGGRSGPAAKGGQGGEVVVHGAFRSRRVDDVATIIGGTGGPGGDSTGLPRATDGGDGGNVVLLEAFMGVPIAEGSERVAEAAPSAHWFFQTSGSGGQGGPCQPGLNGASGGNSTGGSGANGSNGAHGSTTAPAGQPGGNGGAGGNSSGANGTDAGNGGNCCGSTKGPGGSGGTGGKGGNGKGGPGGSGGNGYFDGEISGAGGTGGNGGPGGNGTGGNGAKGGNGGIGCPGGDGGAGGAAGTGEAGAGGVGGAGGTGTPPGATGSEGGAGGVTPGTTGTNGTNGGQCGSGCP